MSDPRPPALPRTREILEALWADAVKKRGERPGPLAVDVWRDDDHRFQARQITPDELREALEETGGVPGEGGSGEP